MTCSWIESIIILSYYISHLLSQHNMNYNHRRFILLEIRKHFFIILINIQRRQSSQNSPLKNMLIWRTYTTDFDIYFHSIILKAMQ